MRLQEFKMENTAMRRAITLATWLIILAIGTSTFGAGRKRPPDAKADREYFESRSLFEKLWLSVENAPAGGDGLGPLFNAQSCVGCHNLGGTGGAGDNAKNVQILSAVPGVSLVGDRKLIFQGELEDLHPGFRNHSSIVLHRHSISIGDEKRLGTIGGYTFAQTRDDLFALRTSQRSAPALFGAGRIDAIPDSVLVAAEKRTFPGFPEIKGRVSRVRGGRLGKFGWKGQTASLQDFVLAACANELGLEVRGQHQPSLIASKDFDPTKQSLDLSDEETSLMTRFVAGLPAPIVHPVGNAEWGLKVFETVGCATCHARNMGEVRGLYSDLLLHDLGDRFVSFGGGYGGGSMELVEKSPGITAAPASSGEAGPTEWRTTPLWGVADSPPYLHDGRAATLHEAIMLHGGEAEKTTKRYSALSFSDRQALLGFLHSQIAPSQPGRPADHAARSPRGRRK